MKRITLQILIVYLGLLTLNALAQVGQKIAECDKILGAPVKEFKVASPPTKIFIKENIQAQISYENGVATAGVYHVAMIVNGMKKPISNIQLKKIYGWNGIAEGELVAANFKELPQLDGLYQKTKDGKLVVMHDKKKNMVAVSDFRTLVKYIEGELKKE